MHAASKGRAYRFEMPDAGLIDVPDVQQDGRGTGAAVPGLQGGVPLFWGEVLPCALRQLVWGALKCIFQRHHFLKASK